MKQDDDLDLNLKPLFKDRKERYVVWPDGYVLDRNLFRWYILFVGVITIILVAPAIFAGEYYQAYAYCPEDAQGGCYNLLYGKCDLPACQEEELYPGQMIGERPKSLLSPILFFMVLPLIILALFNHFNQKSERYEYVRHQDSQHHRKR